MVGHGFQSHEVERQVGGALHDKYGIRADMKKFEVCVRVDVVMDHVLVCSMCNVEMLSKRHKLAFVRSVTLKPNVAFAMLHLAALKEGQALLDPFCGGGTIPLEAACMLGDKAGRLAGCDKSATVVEGAIANARAADVADKISFQLFNARTLERVYKDGEFDAIVTNPPWGLRVGKDADLEKIYKGFLCSAARVVRAGGRVVFVVQRCEMVLDIVRRSGLYRILSLTAIKTGDQIPTIFVLENLRRDAVREALKTQVRTLVPLCHAAAKRAAQGGHGGQEAAGSGSGSRGASGKEKGGVGCGEQGSEANGHKSRKAEA